MWIACVSAWGCVVQQRGVLQLCDLACEASLQSLCESLTLLLSRAVTLRQAQAIAMFNSSSPPDQGQVSTCRVS